MRRSSGTMDMIKLEHVACFIKHGITVRKYIGGTCYTGGTLEQKIHHLTDHNFASFLFYFI